MTVVVAAAIVRSGRVLAARRTHPGPLAGFWELPGGKPQPGETAAQTLVREVREELGCLVETGAALAGRAPVSPGYQLTAHVAWIVAGQACPREHDAIRWVGPEELDEVEWLEPDRPFLPQIRDLLLEGQRLEGGNVGGAVRVGRSVRRAQGSWTPAVHALLDHLAVNDMAETPRILGFDGAGREVLSFLPGRVPDVDAELVSLPLLVAAMGWLRRFHDVVQTFAHPGPWRNDLGASTAGQLICHQDFAPYNVALTSSADGERLTGVFDWDMAGPGTRLEELAFAAWNWVPMWRPLPAQLVANRLVAMCEGYGEGPTPHDVVAAVVPRIERSIHVISEGQAAGDPGMLNLAAGGEPDRTRRCLDALRLRLPAIVDALGSS